MRILAVLAALATLAVAAPAHADWQYTKWGMTRDEVISASGGRAALDSESALRGLDKVVLAGQEFRILFAFDDNGKLKAVFLEGDLLSHDMIKAALAASFGPSVATVGDAYRYIVIVDAKKGNQIWLRGATLTTIIYRLIENGF